MSVYRILCSHAIKWLYHLYKVEQHERANGNYRSLHPNNHIFRRAAKGMCSRSTRGRLSRTLGGGRQLHPHKTRFIVMPALNYTHARAFFIIYGDVSCLIKHFKALCMDFPTDNPLLKNKPKNFSTLIKYQRKKSHKSTDIIIKSPLDVLVATL